MCARARVCVCVCVRVRVCVCVYVCAGKVHARTHKVLACALNSRAHLENIMEAPHTSLAVPGSRWEVHMRARSEWLQAQALTGQSFLQPRGIERDGITLFAHALNVHL